MGHLLRFPIVWVWARPTAAPGDLCSFNHETAAHLVAEHLRARGHKRVAFCNPKKGKSTLEHIKKEFRFACETHGLALTPLESATARVTAWPEPALTSADELVPLVAQWRALPAATRPTAIFVPADNIAVHLYTALAQLGVRIPRDVSIVSCNNERSLLHGFKPSLTTVDVGAAEIGRRSVTQLLARLSNPGDQLNQTVLVEPTLLLGGSVAEV